MEPPDVNNTREAPGKAPRSPGPGTLTCPAYAPGSGGLPSSPIQALQGSGILITTKNLTKDPLPLPRCARSPRRGSPDPVQKSGSRGERRGAAAPPASPRGSAGARRSPVPGNLVRKSSAGSFGASPAGTAARWLRETRWRPVTSGRNERERNETKRNEKQRKETQTIAVSRSPPSPALPRSRAARPARPGPPRLGLAVAGCGADPAGRSPVRTGAAPAAASWAGLQTGHSRGYLRGHRRRDRRCRGMRSGSAACTSHGYGPSGMAGSPSAAGGVRGGGGA